MNNLLKVLKDNVPNISYDEIRNVFYDSINKLSDLSGKVNLVVGNSISYRDFVRLEVEDEEANTLFHREIQPGSFSEIEEQFNTLGNDLIAYFKKNTHSELYPFITSDTGINKKQFTQFAGFIGLKPDMSGNVIPIAIKDNFLRGLSSLESYYINSCGTKKALVTNNKYTKKSGYLTRKLELSNIDNYHDDSIEDCGTKHFIKFNISSNEKFKQILGRHYYLLDKDGNKLSDQLYTVTENNMGALIGTTIGLRSPVTCAAKHCCATCYGRELSKVNKDINTGISGTLKLTEPLTQMLLSAKHCATCC